MSNPDVLKEFLVKLGFKADEASLNRITRNIEEITKKAATLATTFAAATTAIGLGVQRFASHMQQLHFAAQRTGSSVKNIKAIEYATKQLGGTAEGALSSVEGLARLFREKPEAEGWLSGFINTRDAAGNLRDMTDMLMDLGDAMNRMPYQAKGIGDIIGIDENTRLALQNGAFRQYVEERRRLAGDEDGAAKKADAFEKKLAALQERFNMLAVTVGDRLLNTLGPALERFATWVEKNGDLLSNRLADGLQTVLNLSATAGPVLESLADFFVKLDKATEGWSTKLIAAGVALRALGLGGVAGGVVKSAASGGLFTRLLGAIGLATYSKGLNSGEDAVVAKMRESWGRPWRGAPEGPASGPIGPRPMSGQAAAVMAFFQRLGWTHDQAAGITANLKNESSFNSRAENAGHYGLAQWDANRQANFRAWSGKDIRNSTMEEQLGFIHHELTKGMELAAGNALRATSSAAAASDVIFRMYERAADATGPRRAADAVQIAQNVTVNVDGGSNPAATGKAVAGAIGNQSNELARLFQRTLDPMPAY